jgi:hypothetical protein
VSCVPWPTPDMLRADHSEFGMQGYPDKRTVRAWQDDGDDTQNFPQSRVSVNHNKAVRQPVSLGSILTHARTGSSDVWSSISWKTSGGN